MKKFRLVWLYRSNVMRSLYWIVSVLLMMIDVLYIQHENTDGRKYRGEQLKHDLQRMVMDLDRDYDYDREVDERKGGQT